MEVLLFQCSDFLIAVLQRAQLLWVQQSPSTYPNTLEAVD